MSESKSYLEYRRELKNGKPSQHISKKEKQELKEFFDSKLATQEPQKCENCGKPLCEDQVFNPRTFWAHILPKSKNSGVPSVAKHPANGWYSCGDCHTNYDKKGADFVMKMKVFKILKARVATFFNQIAPAELKRVPDYFKPR